MMRKVILTGLIAATLIPGLAQAQDHDRRDDRRDVRVERHDERRDIRDDRRDIRDDHRAYREDWRDYRRTNPDIYRGNAWAAPRGYGYRRVVVGYRFDPIFYDRRYWVDPYRYHLRPVASWQRWVRYGNDVALIDVRTGRLIDINYGFFY